MVKTLYLTTGVSPLAAYIEPKWLERNNQYQGCAAVHSQIAGQRSVRVTQLADRLLTAGGRETLLDAPAYHVEELADGSVLVVAVEDPMGRHDSERS